MNKKYNFTVVEGAKTLEISRTTGNASNNTRKDVRIMVTHVNATTLVTVSAFDWTGESMTSFVKHFWTVKEGWEIFKALCELMGVTV